jgi:CheY-like chemotaxis protein
MTSPKDKPSILVVDDVDFFREVMVAYFQRTPAEILTASSGLEAFDLAVKQRPDLIYLDAGMPGMSGLDCCRKLKVDVRTNHIPVVVVFTPGREATLEEVQDCGCDGYLTKPFGKEEFLNLGHRFLFHIERRERRVSCQMAVDFTMAGQAYRGRAYDISRHGIYVEFRDELPPVKQISTTFMLPTVCSELLEACGHVVWVNQGFPRNNLKLPQGFGVEFQGMPGKTVQAIEKYLEIS